MLFSPLHAHSANIYTGLLAAAGAGEGREDAGLVQALNTVTWDGEGSTSDWLWQWHAWLLHWPQLHLSIPHAVAFSQPLPALCMDHYGEGLPDLQHKLCILLVFCKLLSQRVASQLLLDEAGYNCFTADLC